MNTSCILFVFIFYKKLQCQAIQGTRSMDTLQLHRHTYIVIKSIIDIKEIRTERNDSI